MNNLLNESMKNYVDSLSSGSGTPGGGNAIGVVCSFACALMLMSLRIAVLKKGGDVADSLELQKTLEDIQKKCFFLAEKDSEKFKNVLAKWKKGGSELESALKESAEVSLDIAEICLELLQHIDMQDLSRYTMIMTDVGIAVELANACFSGAVMNYKINVKGIKNQVVFNNLKKIRNRVFGEFEDLYSKLSEKIKSLI